MRKRILLLLTGILLCTVTLLAQDVPVGVVVAFKKGNAQELSAYFGDKVDLVILDKANNTNKNVAKELMDSFFTRNKVKNFAVNHKGKRDESGFFVGTLTTENGNFRVNCFFRLIKNKYYIHQIRIDKANE